MANNFFTICSFFYSIMLNIVYFRRKNIGNMETKIYSCLAVTNLLNILFAIMCYFTILYKNAIPVLNDIISKSLLLLFITWELLFTGYIIVITRKKTGNTNKKIFAKGKWLLLLLYLVITFVVFYLKLEYSNVNKVVYSYGSSANFIYFLTAILIVFWIILIVKNYEVLKSKKSIPIILFIFLVLIVVVIQKMIPGLLLITATETFITMLMYFTIENPDRKILDELHNAKLISDNANEEKTIFLYNMTNEIRGITKDINVCADEILDKTTGKKIDKETINNSARDIKSLTAMFNSITNEILDVSSIDSQGIKIYDNKYNIKVLANGLGKVYESKCQSKGLEFRFNMQSDTPEYLYGDGIGLKQVLGVILDNSVKYTEKGFVEVSINNIRKNDICRLVIEIEDSGIGMKSEEIDRIFVKNYLNEDNLNLKNNLYNARRLLTLMNGTMVASSTYGKGTKIKVIIDQKVAFDNSELDKYKEMYDNKKILFMGTANTKLINKILKDTNIKLELANTSKDLIAKVKEKYDLILLEEETNAFSLIKKLKDIRSFNTKVILISTNEDYREKFKYRYLDAGFKDCIILPIEEDKFIEEISKYLK